MRNLLLIFLILPLTLYSQSGDGYVNYRAVRTHYGNGSTAQYPAYPSNSAQFDLLFDLTNPANTLLGEGEVDADTSQGFAGGKPPYTNGQSGNVGGEYFAVEYTGWFLAKATGNYLFYLYTDDSSEIWIGDTKVASRYGGSGTASGWIMLEANTWYPLMMRYQEYGGGDYGYLQMYSSMFNGYFYPGHASYPISNQAPVYPHKLDVTYNLNNSLDKTKFKTTLNFPSLNTTSTSKNLSANGVVNYTENNGLDTIPYPLSKKATTAGGYVEWVVIYGFDSTNKRYRIGIDKRKFPDGFDFTKLTELQLFDIYDGPVEYKSNDTYWAEYYWYRDSQYPWGSSAYYTNYMRAGNGFMAFKADVYFQDILGFTPHEVVFDVDETYWSNQNIISIQDIALSFSELTSNSGPGLGGGGTFTTGIEYILGDVNQDGAFDFSDTQLMLQHLFGDTDPFENQTFEDKLRMFESGYDTWPTSGWSNNIPNTNKFIHTLEENNKEKTRSFDIAFLGDVNFSHSHQPSNLSTVAKSAVGKIRSTKEAASENVNLNIEKDGDIIKVFLSIPTNTRNMTGSQFRVHFDNDRIEYLNSEYSNTSISSFSTGRSNYVNIGSFSSDGSQTLNNGLTYQLNFKLKSSTDSTLGLVAVTFMELVSKDGNKVNLDIQ